MVGSLASNRRRCS
uniref:Uncharacterized protein n=1 Tax=Anguilla anguilla TaxID=7936 RepID=A0A0E9UX07_ANGAN